MPQFLIVPFRITVSPILFRDLGCWWVEEWWVLDWLSSHCPSLESNQLSLAVLFQATT